MGKEIERKWLVNSLEGIELQNPQNIKDYYFNKYTRLRQIDNEVLITIKSDGTIERDEFEFTISKAKEKYDLKPVLCKKRYKYPYKGNTFEINVFDIYKGSNKLVIAEIELQDKEQVIEIPEFFGQEITEDVSFYGYNLFQFLK